MRRGTTAGIRRRWPDSLVGLCGIALVAVSSAVSAGQFQLDFDSPEPSWRVRCRQREAKLIVQERRRDEAHQGQAEFLRVKSSAQNTPLRIEHDLPAVRVLDELTASLWIKADRPGATLALRVVIHGSKDPETGEPLTMVVMGEKTVEADQWQKMTCRTTDRAVQDQLHLLRARKKVTIDPGNMYVDRVMVGCQLGTGSIELMLDDFQMSPTVPVEFETDPIVQVSDQGSESVDSKAAAPAEMRMHKLRVDGKPFLPRVIPHRQERPDVLGGAGLNVAWVPDLEAITNTGQFRDQGLWLTSTPPFAKDADGAPLDSDDASLLPFPNSTASVVFWMMGVRRTSESRPRLSSWTNQVRDADRGLHRPLAADVADDERIASRHLDLIGLSRHVLNSGVSLADYRDDLIRRRDRAWPGSLCFTWVQVEPATELMALKQFSNETPVLEPEQIRLQVYAALAAGCRGIGYWTTTPLDAETPGARERLLMVTQLNLELALLEPWLATGNGAQLIPFTVSTQPSPGNKKLTGTAKEAEATRASELTAALIRTDFGALLLPMWLDGNSQFVPGALSAPAATIIVPGGGETATAWQITTTGRVQNLTRETVAGGIRVELSKFDQTAAILVTSDPSIVEQINQRIQSIQERSATVMVELSRLKLERVVRIDQQLQQLGVGQPDSSRLLGQAKLQCDMAEAKLKQLDFHTARQYACVAMQLARVLQRAHWEHAVAKLSSPLVSPFALSFQTLPAHWRLMRSLEKVGKTTHNQLPSGEFEDLDTLIAAGWKHQQRAIDDVQSVAELVPAAKQGKYSLRLASEPTVQEPVLFQFHTPPVSVTSPPLTVHAGTLVKITGWVKTTYPIQRSVDGAIIYDNLLGKTGALRITHAPEWRQFELWRIVPETGTFTLHAEMHGLGEVLLDDIRVTTVAMPAEVAEATGSAESDVKPARFSPLAPFDLRRLSPRRR